MNPQNSFSLPQVLKETRVMCCRPQLKRLHALTAADCRETANVPIKWLHEAELLLDEEGCRPVMSVSRKINEETEQLWRKSGNEELINGCGGGEGQSMASVSPDQHKMFQRSTQHISSPAEEYCGIPVFPPE